MSALTEQLSLRLSIEQREYIKKMAHTLSGGVPPLKLTEADVIRIIINKDMCERNGTYHVTVEAGA
jgi:hypothetical protein